MPPPTTTKELKKFFSGTLVGVNTFYLITEFHSFIAFLMYDLDNLIVVCVYNFTSLLS